MGGPEKSGYCGGKLFPKEKDLIKGIAAAKSLQTLVAIFRSPAGFTLKVFHINDQEKTKRTAKNNKLALLILTKVYQTIKATEPVEAIR